jgi:hypothetical protein
MPPAKFFCLIIVVLAVSCAPQVAPATPVPEVEVSFRAVAPEQTPANAQISLILLDEITGLSLNQIDVPMSNTEEGIWQVTLRLPLGSVGYYRYRLHSIESVDEFDTYGSPIQFRLVLADGPFQKRDVISAWTSEPIARSTGHVIGRVVDAKTLEPLHEAVINVAGKTVFTDSDGGFRVLELPPGEHTLIALTHNGSYLGKHQGVVIGPSLQTPAEVHLEPARLVIVNFELEAPEATFPGVPIRIAGNLSQFGHLFEALPDGSLSEAAIMPEMIPLEGPRYQLSVELYSGSLLRYRYSLGDGLWNTERDDQGGMVLRQITIPDNDIVIRDQIATWEAGQGGATFLVNVPSETPENERVHLQYQSFIWHNPIPMWRLANDAWFYVLYSPLSATSYRYCRNQQCAIADETREFPSDAETTEVNDQIESWQSFEVPAPPTIIAPDIQGRGFEVGIELIPGMPSNKWSDVDSSLAELQALGSNAITFTPTWTVDFSHLEPAMYFEPLHSAFAFQISDSVAAAGALDLQVNMRPTLLGPDATDVSDWVDSNRSEAWWGSWFASYRSFLMTYASIPGVGKFIISASQIAPALPTGNPEAPINAEFRWRELLAELGDRFEGTLALELELGAELQQAPPILDMFDEIHIYWHATLAETNRLDTSLMQLNAGRWIDEVLLARPELQNRTIILSVEYLSADGSATACLPDPVRPCRDVSDFDHGAIVDASISIDLEEQSAALNAMLLEAYERPEVVGFYVRRFNPTFNLQDKSASVYGKPAFELLKYWYPRLASFP